MAGLSLLMLVELFRFLDGTQFPTEDYANLLHFFFFCVCPICAIWLIFSASSSDFILIIHLINQARSIPCWYVWDHLHMHHTFYY